MFVNSLACVEDKIRKYPVEEIQVLKPLVQCLDSHVACACSADRKNKSVEADTALQRIITDTFGSR